ncbi:MAG: serine hydrolase domain-containing protein [Polyangiales bacterium]
MAQSGAPFEMPAPPQGTYAAVTDMDGPGTLILHRTLQLDRAYALRLTLFYKGVVPFDGQQAYRIDVLRAAAEVDSRAQEDLLGTVFQTSSDSALVCAAREVRFDLSAFRGQTVRLRLTVSSERGPIRAGVDAIQLQPVQTTAAAPRAAVCIQERMAEADALTALSREAALRAQRDEFSGALLIARDGRVLLRDAWGKADREADIAADVDTRFHIGSMNKMFTAVAVLQLVHAGKLSLDAPIIEYLPSYPNRELAQKVTVRALLNHTGGTGDIFGPEFDQHRASLREHDDYVSLFGARALDDAVGVHRYSNYGFVLLGSIIEHVTGTSYYDHVRNHVLAPAGMTSTDSLPESEPIAKLAKGYLRSGEAWVSNRDSLPFRGTAAGGGYSTVGDLLRFAQALESGTLIPKPLLAQATTPSADSYGYGFHIHGQASRRSYGHGGGHHGMNGELRVYPELGVVVVALSNFDPPAASQLLQYYVSRMPLPPMAPPRATFTVP